MSHEPNPTDGTASAVHPGAHEPDPDFVDRARRILSGDVHEGDFLVAPEEVTRTVESELARLWSHQGVPASDEVRKRLMADWTLQFAHGGEPVACQRTDRGVIVFAAGTADIQQFLKQFARPEQRPGVVITTPPLWQPPSHTDLPNR